MKIDELNFEYSKDHHYRWGWGTDDTEWFNEPDYEQPFKMTIGRCTRPPKSFREECILATEHLCTQYDKPIYVGLSGGLDSQIVCLTLLELKMPFIPCIIVMENNYNLHDVLNAKEFCEKYNLKYKVFNINMGEFYSKYCPEIVQRYKITNARTTMQLWLEQFTRDGIFIMAGGDLQLTRYKIGEPTYDTTDGLLINPLSSTAPMTKCTWGSHPTPILQHLISQGVMGTTKYFMYSPELIASVVLSKEVESFVNIQDVLYSTALVPRSKFWLLYNYIAKSQLYANNWPELILRPKYHGFEFVEKNIEYSKLKKQAIKEYSVENDKKGIYIEYEELKEYFSSDGPQKIWYSNPLVKQTSSIKGFIESISLREQTKNDLFEDEDLLDEYEGGGIDI